MAIYVGKHKIIIKIETLYTNRISQSLFPRIRLRPPPSSEPLCPIGCPILATMDDDNEVDALRYSTATEAKTMTALKVNQPSQGGQGTTERSWIERPTNPRRRNPWNSSWICMFRGIIHRQTENKFRVARSTNSTVVVVVGVGRLSPVTAMPVQADPKIICQNSVLHIGRLHNKICVEG